MKIVLAEKHIGMKISADGMLSRLSAKGSRITNIQRFGLEELNGHLHELASKFYAGDASVVDEFLQLYALDKERPTP